ncbi:unnamed protein product [Ectocarpus fasciculatus]
MPRDRPLSTLQTSLVASTPRNPPKKCDPTLAAARGLLTPPHHKVARCCSISPASTRQRASKPIHQHAHYEYHRPSPADFLSLLCLVPAPEPEAATKNPPQPTSLEKMLPLLPSHLRRG